MSARVAQPEFLVLIHRMQRAVGMYGSHRIAELEEYRQVLGTLKDLKRLGVVDAARCTERPALEPRIVLGAAVEVFLLLLERLRRIGNHVPLDDAGARRRILPAGMRFEVVVRRAGGLPDAGEIRFTPGHARNLRRRGLSALREYR